MRVPDHPIARQPFLDWCEQREAEYRRVLTRLGELYVDQRATTQLLKDIGWHDDTGTRRLHRWRYQHQGDVEHGMVEEALCHAGVTINEVAGYEHLKPLPLAELGDEEEYCWACRAFVNPVLENSIHLCPWCDEPLTHIDLSSLPARENGQTPEPVRMVSLVVRYKPRKPKGVKQVLYDAYMDERRAVLEDYVKSGNRLHAARLAIELGVPFSNAQSAANSLLCLFRREGWKSRTSVRRALRDGTWNRVRDPGPPVGGRRVLNEAQIQEALWLYLYDELSFGEIALRMIARSSSSNVPTLKRQLQIEWNQRGWPRRTFKAAGALRIGHHFMPPDDRRCRARNARDGTRCSRWALPGETRCPGHDAGHRPLRRGLAKRASVVAYADAVDAVPFGYWIRKQARQLGSVMAVHRRLQGAVSYDMLSRWSSVWSDRPANSRAAVVRRSTVDRILEAWGDGTTFEDIYMPVESDDEDLVPQS